MKNKVASSKRASLFAFLCLCLIPLIFNPRLSLAKVASDDEAPWGTRGQKAIDKLGKKLDDVARKNKTSKDELEKHLKEDPNLWVDNQDNLMFLDEFVVQQAPGANGPTTLTDPATIPYDQTFLLHSLPGAEA